MAKRIVWWSVGAVVLTALVGFGFAQTPTPRGLPRIDPNPLTTPNGTTIISGNDLGFQVEGRRNGEITGRFMVRINGNWIPLAGGPGTHPLSMR